MQSSMCRKFANLLIFHSEASKTEIYCFIPVKMSAEWLPLRSSNIQSLKSRVLN